MAKMTLGANKANHGHWSMLTTLMGVTDLIELLSKNVLKGGDVWASDFYLGDGQGQKAMQRKPSTKRVDALKEYIKSNIVGDEVSCSGALPALSVAIMGDVETGGDGSIELSWDKDFKAVLVDGMGRYTALKELYDNEGLDLNVAVTFYTKKDLDEEGCRQLLHDFNRYATTMRPVGATTFDSNDPLKDFCDALLGKLTALGVRISEGHLRNAGYFFYTTNESAYSASKETKDRRNLDKALLESDGERIDEVATWIASCLNTPKITKEKLKATTMQILLHGLAEVRGFSADDVRENFIKPFTQNTTYWNMSLRKRDEWNSNQTLLGLRKPNGVEEA